MSLGSFTALSFDRIDRLNGMIGKHFINGVEDTIVRGLRASLYGNPSLRLLEAEKGTSVSSEYNLLS